MAAAEPAISPAAKVSGQEDGDPRLEEARWRPVLRLSCRLTVDVPLPGCKVKDLLKLRAGSVLATVWRVNRDVPLRVNGTLIAWGEFEGAKGRLAVRVTDLA